MPPKTWYAYEVSCVFLDMLRYDNAYISADIHIHSDECYALCGQEYKAHFRTTTLNPAATVYSHYKPTIARWASFNVKVSNIRRVTSVPQDVYTIAHDDYYRGTLKKVYLRDEKKR